LTIKPKNVNRKLINWDWATVLNQTSNRLGRMLPRLFTTMALSGCAMQPPPEDIPVLVLRNPKPGEPATVSMKVGDAVLQQTFDRSLLSLFVDGGAQNVLNACILETIDGQPSTITLRFKDFKPVYNVAEALPMDPALMQSVGDRMVAYANKRDDKDKVALQRSVENLRRETEDCNPYFGLDTPHR
jgi:hypothetical protein